jgi:malate dehydrogenase (oxaloacetate-decarboxylating)
MVLLPTLKAPRHTALRGLALLRQPALNKGTGFSAEERRLFDLEGLLPAQHETLAQQVERCWQAFQAIAQPLERFAYVDGLRHSNWVLFYAFLRAHLEAVLPVVYTPTVGAVIQRFSQNYRTPQNGLFLNAAQAGRVEAVLRAASHSAIRMVLVTDAEGILGIGDQGVGGIHICQGKLAVYTLCAGLDPDCVLPVVLDVGTNRQSLLNDPLYPGLRQPRLQGAAYDAFVDEFVAAVSAVFPGACLHWEDFGRSNAKTILDRYRDTLPSFNDDIQGTSGVASAAVLAACQGLGQRLQDQRIVIFGAGTAGCGIADGLLRLLQSEGLTAPEARQRIWAVDRTGLVTHATTGVSPAALELARDPRELVDWPRNPDGVVDLQIVVDTVKPTVLIGTSTVAGAFSQAVVHSMQSACERPIILPLSNPTHLAEAAPADLWRWTDGRALVATGSPFPPVDGRVVGQCNNCFLFPGLGFAAVAVGVTRITDDMIDAGLHALAREIPASRQPAEPLMPALAEAPRIGRVVAEAIAMEAVAAGLARLARTPDEAIHCLDAAEWSPIYQPLLPSVSA